MGCGAPELLVQALRERFDQSAKPKDLQLIQVHACKVVCLSSARVLPVHTSLDVKCMLRQQ